MLDYSKKEIIIDKFVQCNNKTHMLYYEYLSEQGFYSKIFHFEFEYVTNSYDFMK